MSALWKNVFWSVLVALPFLVAWNEGTPYGIGTWQYWCIFMPMCFFIGIAVSMIRDELRNE